MKLTFYNEIIQFDYELGTLIAASEDPMFTNYLQGVKDQLQTGAANLPELKSEVIGNYDIYATKMNNLGCPVERFYFRAIYGNMEAPEIKNPLFAASTPAAEQVSVLNEDVAQPSIPVTESQPEYIPSDVPAQQYSPEYESENITDSVPSQNYYQSDISSQTYDQYQAVDQTVNQPVNQTYSQPADQPLSQTAYSPQPEQASQPANYNPYTGQYIQMPQAPQTASSVITSPKAEYAVGAIVMSVLGSVFLLTGLVYFAINYLDTFAQGMIMYAVCAIVLLVSELVIRRAIPKLSAVFTAIGISGVFLSTVVNYKSLGNINVVAAAIILALCAGGVCLFGYARKSQLYSVIGFLAAFVSSVAIGSSVSAAEFIAITLGTLIISTMWLFFPVAKRYDVLTPLMILAELSYFIASLTFKIVPADTSLEITGRIVFTAASWLVVCIIYFVADNWNAKNCEDPHTVSVINFVIMLIAAFFYGLVIRLMFDSRHLEENEAILYGVIIYTVIIVPQIILAFLKISKKSNAAMTYYISALITGFMIIGCTDTVYITVPVITFYSILARVLAKKNENVLSYKVIDIVVQSIFMLMAIFTAGDIFDTDLKKYFTGLILLAGLVAGILINTGFKTAVQIMFVYTTCYVVSVALLPSKLGEAASMGIVLLFTYMINNFKKFRGPGFKVYNYCMLVFDLILLAISVNGDLSAEGVFIFCIAAIFGLAFVILMLNKEYGLFFAGYYIAIPVYLTFVAVLLPIDNGFILSIILMGIALVSVIIGFVLKEKAIRIYGLVLSILVCAKIALVDFVSIGDAKYKTLMYILVGAFALMIGCIYMVLENRENKKKNEIR